MEEGAMAKELLPDALWARIAPLLPPEPPKPKGGRPRVSDRAALTGILFVLKTGIPWEYLPAEMGCGSGMTCWRRLRDWYQAGVWRRLHQVLLEELAQADRIDWDRAALDSAAVPALGGQEMGKNPTDRGKQGTKRHLLVYAHGIPLTVLVSAANVHDSKMMLATVDAIEPIRAKTRQAPSPTAQAPCRQGLRLPSPPSGPAQAPHHPPHRPLWCRAQEPPGTLPLGGRTDALLAQPLPAPEDPLRAPG
jgi:transposase